ncbi:MAG: dephospho-CoA kinase [Kiritimatiellae bacterium]|nr:dephospho-CoA kinase [Kiritimatiellia bacterium]
MKIALTGGIACGKSLLSSYLNSFGIETLDADDIVHELIPAEERRRIASVIFGDKAARKALEARIHPLVRSRLEAWEDGAAEGSIRLSVIPLLFEVHWDGKYDIICCVASKRENQIARMVATRGYSREDAEARLAAQMPVCEKAARSQYIIQNDGTAEELRMKAQAFADWLKEIRNGRRT